MLQLTHFAPDSYFRHEDQQLPQPGKVFLASSSPKRLAAVTHFLQGSAIETFDLNATEPRTGSPLEVAGFKVAQVRDLLKANRELQRNQGALIMGFDTQTSAPALTEAGLQMTTRHKPTSDEEIKNNFRDMIYAAVRKGESCMYETAAGSVIQTIRANAAPSFAVERHRVELDPSLLAYLADGGYEKYKQVFRDTDSDMPMDHFYPATLTDLSAGMSLPTFLRLRMVLSINGVSYQSKEFRSEVERALMTALIGAPLREMFRPFNTQVHRRFGDWTWFQKKLELIEQQVEL